VSENKRTPGPWVAGPYAAVWTGIDKDLSGKWDESATGSAQIIATLDNPDDRNLVAAAPDLYEALAELSDLVEDLLRGDYKADSFTTQPARRALAKARGEA